MASTWFLLDIAFYSQNLFQKDIFSAIGWIPPPEIMNVLEEVSRIARAQTLITLCSTIPGYWFTVAFIDKLGQFTIQLMGFYSWPRSYSHWPFHTTIGHIRKTGLDLWSCTPWPFSLLISVQMWPRSWSSRRFSPRGYGQRATGYRLRI